MSKSELQAARETFYDHKRALHGGAYDRNCSLCERLWAAFVAASKAAA